MKNKILVLAVGIGLIVGVIALTSLLSPGRDGGYALFQDALNGREDATCTFTNTEGLTTSAADITYYISVNDMRIVESFNDTEVDAEEEWSSYTLLTEGLVYTWDSTSPSGTVDTFSGSPETYLYGGNIVGEFEDNNQQSFEEAEARCEPGIQTDNAFVVPESISFIDQSGGVAPVDET